MTATTSQIVMGIVTDVVAACAAATTAYLAWQLNRLQKNQHLRDQRASDANYRLSLFHMRVEIYEAVQSFLAEFITEGRPTVAAAVKLRRHARNARFLFPAEVQAFVAELAKKGFDYQRAYLLREPLRERAYNKELLTESEAHTKDACLAEMHAIEDWLTEVWESGRYLSVFEPFLTLPETLS